MISRDRREGVLVSILQLPPQHGSLPPGVSYWVTGPVILLGDFWVCLFNQEGPDASRCEMKWFLGYQDPLTRFSGCSWMYTPLRLTLLSPLDCNQPGSSALGFPRQEYWRGLPLPPPGDLPNPGMEPGSRVSPSLAGGFFTWSATWEAPPVVYSSRPISFCLSICTYVCM